MTVPELEPCADIVEVDAGEPALTKLVTVVVPSGAKTSTVPLTLFDGCAIVVVEEYPPKVVVVVWYPALGM